MPTPQEGIFKDTSNTFYILEYKVDFSLPATKLKDAIKSSLSTVSENVNLVICFGKQFWNILQPDWEPIELINFETLVGIKDFTIPSTQRDIFFWIHSQNQSNNLDTVLNVQKAMCEVAELELDLAGFRYHDSRDLTGFVDGSANPKEEKRQLAAVIPNDQIGAGGSYVLSQKWHHNLKAFSHLSKEEQEKVMGRTKPDSIELEGNTMPVDSHVSRTDVKVDGIAQKIYRRSIPFGSATEQGLYFLSFSCEISRISIQLERMYGLTEDGQYDKLIEYSKPQTSSYWFAPSSEDLQNVLK
jgi:putative iron-dependent peroxidase